MKGPNCINIHWCFESGPVGCELEGTLTVPANATEEETNNAVLEDIFDKVDWSWKREQ